MTKLKLNKEVSEVNFVDPNRQIKHIRRIIKKQGGEIAHDIAKLEKQTKKLQDEIDQHSKRFEKLNEKLSIINDDFTKPSKYKTVESLATFRDHQENMCPNYAPSTSRYSTYRPDYPSVDRADLLIMCNKIREDVKRSIDDTLRSNTKKKNTKRLYSQQVTKRDNESDLHHSIENYRRGFNVTAKNSPIPSVKHQTKKSASNHKTIDITPKSSLTKTREAKISARTRRKTKPKETLSKLDEIYKELQSIEDDFAKPHIRL